MQCLNCGGQLEWAGGGQHARCMRCLSLFSQQNGQLTPIVVQAPGGGFNPEFNNIFAGNLGFGPPPPGAQPMPPPQAQPQHDYGAGKFDLGGGQQLRVKINGQSPENYMKNKVSGMIWGWIIGLIILAIVVLGGIGLGIYIYFQAKSGMADATSGVGGTPSVGTWDGKSTLTCGGNDNIAITGVTASAGINASANCKVALVNVNITAPVGITASGNAGVTMTGGSLNSTTNSVVASANAKVVFAGTKVTGKVNKSGNAQVIGAPL